MKANGTSLPMRGAWIETAPRNPNAITSSRSPCGGRGLKLPANPLPCTPLGGRSPCGGRGLKPISVDHTEPAYQVAPHAGGVD